MTVLSFARRKHISKSYFFRIKEALEEWLEKADSEDRVGLWDLDTRYRARLLKYGGDFYEVQIPIKLKSQ
jgi:hypothetical protein